MVCVYLAGITWVVFGQTLRHQFINFDDTVYVYENPEVARGLSLQGIRWAFTHPVLYLWTPLVTISHMLDCQLYGLAPAGHHLTNVLLHIATAILLFLVLRQMTGALWPSAFVAAVFAIHPLRVESVAWVAERKDVLSGVFFMLTLGAYVRYARHPPSPGRYVAVMFLFVLGLLVKPMLVTLPCVLLLLDYWPLDRWKTGNGQEPGAGIGFGRLVLEKFPLFAISATSSLLALFGGGTAPTPAPGLFPLPLRIGNAVVSYATYLGQMVYPAGLALLYPFPPAGQPVWRVVLALFLLGAISAGVFLWRRRKRYLVVGWLWYLGMLAPVSGVFQMGLEAHADRYTYLPQIGLYILITWAVADLAASWRHRRAILAGLAVTVLAALTVCARVQASYWYDSESLWRRTLQETSGDPIPHINLGGALLQKGLVDEAISQYQKALEINPRFAEARFDLGDAFLQKGMVDAAISQYRKAVEIKPDYAQAQYSLGCALFQKGEVEEAIARYEKATEIKPGYAQAYTNWAHVLATSRKASVRNGPKAVELAEQANRLTGGENPIVLATLAAAYAEAGRFPEAVQTGGRARQLAGMEGNSALAGLFDREIACYEADSPWRDTR